MNEFQAFTKRVMGGFEGYLRIPSDGSAKPILTKGGKPQVFPTELQALASVTDHLVRYVNGHLYRDGAVAGGAMAAAEALFTPKDTPPKVIRQRGKSRHIKVETKRRGGR